MLQVILSNHNIRKEVKILLNSNMEKFENIKYIYDSYEWSNESIEEIFKSGDPDIIIEKMMKGIIATAVVNATDEDEVMDIIASIISCINRANNFSSPMSFVNGIRRCYDKKHHYRECEISLLDLDEEYLIAEDNWENKIILSVDIERFFNSGIIDEIVDNLNMDKVYKNRNIDIFKSYYARGCGEITYRELAEKYNLSHQRIYQIVCEIQKKLERRWIVRFRLRELMDLL